MVRSSLGSAPLRCLSTSALSVSMTCWAVSRLFCKFKAYTSTVGTLSKVADGLNSIGVADLTFFLKEVNHLVGVKHQTHSVLGSHDVALKGLGRCLQSDFTVLGVINIGSVEWNSQAKIGNNSQIVELFPEKMNSKPLFLSFMTAWVPLQQPLARCQPT